MMVTRASSHTLQATPINSKNPPPKKKIKRRTSVDHGGEDDLRVGGLERLALAQLELAVLPIRKTEGGERERGKRDEPSTPLDAPNSTENEQALQWGSAARACRCHPCPPTIAKRRGGGGKRTHVSQGGERTSELSFDKGGDTGRGGGKWSQQPPPSKPRRTILR